MGGHSSVHNVGCKLAVSICEPGEGAGSLMLKTTFTECPCFHASFCTLESHPRVQGIWSASPGPAWFFCPETSRFFSGWGCHVGPGSQRLLPRFPGLPLREAGALVPFPGIPEPCSPTHCVARSQLLAALTSLGGCGSFLLSVLAGLSPLSLYCCCGELGRI